jgi:hypothetical protein
MIIGNEYIRVEGRSIMRYERIEILSWKTPSSILKFAEMLPGWLRLI